MMRYVTIIDWPRRARALHVHAAALGEKFHTYTCGYVRRVCNAQFIRGYKLCIAYST